MVGATGIEPKTPRWSKILTASGDSRRRKAEISAMVRAHLTAIGERCRFVFAGLGVVAGSPGHGQYRGRTAGPRHRRLPGAAAGQEGPARRTGLDHHGARRQARLRRPVRIHPV